MRRPLFPSPRRAHRTGRVGWTAMAAGLAALLTASALGACDASPYAATVNGTTIKEAQLNTELRWAAASTDYTTTLLGVYNDVHNAQLTEAGATANTYSTGWSAYTLTQMVEGQILAQAVTARGAEPTSDLYTAALGGIEIENGGVTGSGRGGGVTQMSPAYLVDVTQRLADHAELERPLPLAQLQQDYSTFRAEFYRQVCVRQASVTVTGANGGINYPASHTAAMKAAQAMAKGAPSAGGSSTCYSHEQLDAQSAAFINTVVGLDAGHAAIQKMPYGYQVTALSSRQSLPLAGPVAQVLTAMTYELGDSGRDTVLRGLEAKAKVRVNPAYGSWHPGSAATLAGIVTPSTPAGVPVGTPGSLTASSLGS